MVDLRHYI